MGLDLPLVDDAISPAVFGSVHRLVRRSVRRIKFAMASGFPWQNEFALAYLYLQRAFPR